MYIYIIYKYISIKINDTKLLEVKMGSLVRQNF